MPFDYQEALEQRRQELADDFDRWLIATSRTNLDGVTELQGLPLFHDTVSKEAHGGPNNG